MQKQIEHVYVFISYLLKYNPHGELWRWLSRRWVQTDSTHIKAKHGMAVCISPLIPELERQRQQNSWSLRVESPGSGRHPVSIRWKTIEKDTWQWPLASTCQYIHEYAPHNYICVGICISLYLCNGWNKSSHVKGNSGVKNSKSEIKQQEQWQRHLNAALYELLSSKSSRSPSSQLFLPSVSPATT